MHGIDPATLIQTVGIIGICAIIFAESGLIIGMFFPGDSLLFASGVLASQGHLSIALLLICTCIAAILGDSVGYYFGKKVGPRIFYKKDSFFFNTKHIEKARMFYENYGKKTIILARFIPIVRTLAPILAGVGSMKYKTFISYNIIGGCLWTIGVTMLGYILGSLITDIDTVLLPVILGIVIISFIPAGIDIIKHARKT